MKRHVFSLLSAITLAFSLFLIPVRAIDTTTHTVSGRLLYEDGMTADYQLSMPHFLGALEIALPFYEDGTLVDRDCAVYVLCPPNGEDARMTVTLTDPTLTIYTSSQERTYLAYDGLRLAPVYDGDFGVSSQDGAELFFPSTGLYAGYLYFDYSVEPLDYVYSIDIPAQLQESLSHFYIGCEYVLVLDEESAGSFVQTGILQGYDGVDFTGLSELLSGETPANLLTEEPSFDAGVDRETHRPAKASMEHFQTVMAGGNAVDAFSDVSDEWFAQDVANVCALGLMKGAGDGTFDPEGNVTIAEAITMAARLNSIYRGLGDSFPSADPWYQPYFRYAVANGIVEEDSFSDLEATATRAEVAYILANALPKYEFEAMNDIMSLPDVSDDRSTDPYGEEIFLLYRAGVLTGSDSYGTFYPNTPVTRAAVAAILVRIALPSERLELLLRA